MNKSKTIKIVIAVFAIVLVAVLGSIFVNLGMDWYETLTKPTQWLPSFIIPIAWTIIYLSFAVILFLWIKNKTLPKNIIILLIINGVLNILWCLVFFTLQQLLLGNIVIIINALLAIKLIYEISETKKIYSVILSIYPIWVCIATSLNTALWILN
jgi:tryptophan-rich sensory protein